MRWSRRSRPKPAPSRRRWRGALRRSKPSWRRPGPPARHDAARGPSSLWPGPKPCDLARRAASIDARWAAERFRPRRGSGSTEISMTTPSLETPATSANPLDLIEELVIASDWPFQRAADDEILVEIGGRWTDYRLFFVWQEEASALQFCCRLDAKVPPKARSAINDLLARI